MNETEGRPNIPQKDWFSFLIFTKRLIIKINIYSTRYCVSYD
jgi:hypothetical protein